MSPCKLNEIYGPLPVSPQLWYFTPLCSMMSKMWLNGAPGLITFMSSMFDNLLDTESLSVGDRKRIILQFVCIQGRNEHRVEWWRPIGIKCYRFVKEIGHFYWRCCLVTLRLSNLSTLYQFQTIHITNSNVFLHSMALILAVFVFVQHRYVPIAWYSITKESYSMANALRAVTIPAQRSVTWRKISTASGSAIENF